LTTIELCRKIVVVVAAVVVVVMSVALACISTFVPSLEKVYLLSI